MSPEQVSQRHSEQREICIAENKKNKNMRIEHARNERIKEQDQKQRDISSTSVDTKA